MVWVLLSSGSRTGMAAQGCAGSGPRPEDHAGPPPHHPGTQPLLLPMLQAPEQAAQRLWGQRLEFLEKGRNPVLVGDSRVCTRRNTPRIVTDDPVTLARSVALGTRPDAGQVRSRSLLSYAPTITPGPYKADSVGWNSRTYPRVSHGRRFQGRVGINSLSALGCWQAYVP